MDGTKSVDESMSDYAMRVKIMEDFLVFQFGDLFSSFVRKARRTSKASVTITQIAPTASTLLSTGKLGSRQQPFASISNKSSNSKNSHFLTGVPNGIKVKAQPLEHSSSSSSSSAVKRPKVTISCVQDDEIEILDVSDDDEGDFNNKSSMDRAEVGTSQTNNYDYDDEYEDCYEIGGRFVRRETVNIDPVVPEEVPDDDDDDDVNETEETADTDVVMNDNELYEYEHGGYNYSQENEQEYEEDATGEEYYDESQYVEGEGEEYQDQDFDDGNGQMVDLEEQGQRRRRVLECPFCESKFRGRAVMNEHIDRDHCNGQPVCPQCGKEYNCFRSFHSHLLRHDKSNRTDFKCSYCEKYFNSRKEVTVHERIHTGEHPYTCHLCNRPFKTLSSINRHKIFVHRVAKDRLYECVTCNTAFRNWSLLESHFCQPTVKRSTLKGRGTRGRGGQTR